MNLSTAKLASEIAESEVALVKILAHHYGDGTVYLPKGTPQALYKSCLYRGLVSGDGCVTRKGRELLARFSL